MQKIFDYLLAVIKGNG